MPQLILYLSTTLALLTFVPQELAAQSTKDEPEQKAGSYQGVASCASSACHGSNSAKSSSSVLQNEYITWHKHDRHSKAWTSLTSNQSLRIAKHLEITDPTQSEQCLKCHSTYVSPLLRAEKFRIEDGVGCESCHGAAKKWLKAHSSAEASHKENIELGMHNLSDLSVRANLCLSCHYGTDDQAVTHRLIAAGHPRLSFELDTFSAILPLHWRFDQDYVDRKGNYSSTIAWLNGQLEQTRSSFKALADPKRSQSLRLPELSQYYCYSCHHSLSDQQFMHYEYDSKLGQIRPNLASPKMLLIALDLLSPERAAELGKLLLELEDHTQITELNLKANQLLEFSKEITLPSSMDLVHRRELLNKILSFGRSLANPNYELAEQITMGLSSINLELNLIPKANLAQLYKLLEDPNHYKAHEFSKALKSTSSSKDRLP